MTQNSLLPYLQNQITQITLNMEHIQKDMSHIQTQFEQKLFQQRRDINSRSDQLQVSIEQLKQQFDYQLTSYSNKLVSIDETKMDQKETFQMMESNRTTLQDDIDLLKNELTYQKKYFEEQLNDKIKRLDIVSLTENVNQFRDQLKNQISEQQRTLQEQQTLTKSLLTANKKSFFQELERITQIIESLKNEISEQNSINATKCELETKMSQINIQFEQKSDLIEVQNALNTQQIDIAQRFQEFKDEVRTVLELQGNEFYQLINKKANHQDVIPLLNQKVDMETLLLKTEDKVPLKDFQQHMSLIENMAIDLSKKQDSFAFAEYKEATFLQLQEIQQDLYKKLSKRDLKDILDKKANHEDVSKAFGELQSILNLKFNIEEFKLFEQRQQILNEQLCSQNIVAKWIYKGTYLSPGSLVPWNAQSINTIPENYLWDRDKPNIIVVTPGMYEITLGFYAKKKPKIDVMVNGETIINAVNNSSYVVHHSSGKLKDTKSSTTGLTMIDFILLPSRARINIAYQGDLGEGFLGLRKI